MGPLVAVGAVMLLVSVTLGCAWCGWFAQARWSQARERHERDILARNRRPTRRAIISARPAPTAAAVPPSQQFHVS